MLCCCMYYERKNVESFVLLCLHNNTICISMVTHVFADLQAASGNCSKYCNIICLIHIHIICVSCFVCVSWMLCAFGQILSGWSSTLCMVYKLHRCWWWGDELDCRITCTYCQVSVRSQNNKHNRNVSRLRCKYNVYTIVHIVMRRSEITNHKLASLCEKFGAAGPTENCISHLHRMKFGCICAYWNGMCLRIRLYLFLRSFGKCNGK